MSRSKSAATKQSVTATNGQTVALADMQSVMQSAMESMFAKMMAGAAPAVQPKAETATATAIPDKLLGVAVKKAKQTSKADAVKADTLAGIHSLPRHDESSRKVEIADRQTGKTRQAPLYLQDATRSFLESRIPAVIEFAQLDSQGQDTGRRFSLIRKKTAAGSLTYTGSDLMIPLAGEDDGIKWAVIAKTGGVWAMVSQFDREAS